MDNDFEHYYNATIRLKAEVETLKKQLKLPEGIEQSIKDTLFENGVSNRGHITRQILSLIRQDKK